MNEDKKTDFCDLLEKARAGADVEDAIDHAASILFGEENTCTFGAISQAERQVFADLLIATWEKSHDIQYLELLYFSIPYLSDEQEPAVITYLKNEAYRPDLLHIVEALQQWIVLENPSEEAIKACAKLYARLLPDGLCHHLAEASFAPDRLLLTLSWLQDQEPEQIRTIEKFWSDLVRRDVVTAAQFVAGLDAFHIDALLEKIEDHPDQELAHRALLSVSKAATGTQFTRAAIDELSKRPNLVYTLLLEALELSNNEACHLSTCVRAVKSANFLPDARKVILSDFLHPDMPNGFRHLTTLFLEASDTAEIGQFLEYVLNDENLFEGLATLCNVQGFDRKLIDAFMKVLIHKKTSAKHLHLAAKISRRCICLSGVSALVEKAKLIKVKDILQSMLVKPKVQLQAIKTLKRIRREAEAKALQSALDAILSPNSCWKNDGKKRNKSPTWYEHQNIFLSTPNNRAYQELCSSFEALDISREQIEAKLASVLTIK